LPTNTCNSLQYQRHQLTLPGSKKNALDYIQYSPATNPAIVPNAFLGVRG